MSSYCTHCGSQISSEEKFCRYCGSAIHKAIKTNNRVKSPNPNGTENVYKFFVDKATFRFMSTTIKTSVTVKNNILSTSMKCKSRMLNKKTLIGQVNISNIRSAKFSQHATIALLDLFLFGILLLAFAIDASNLLTCAILSGVILWRTLIPSLEIKTKDRRKFNILFSPQDNKKEMFKLVAQITGKEIDEDSDIKIPFSKKPFVAVLVFALIGFIVAAIFSGLPDVEAENNAALVQNGYLGQYTDITVQEILDSNYGMLYENEEWESGATDSGEVIVQVKYYNEGMEDDATTIQFTMLNEECFEITAFVDPLNPVEKPTDLLAAMNYNYLLAYVAENRSVAGDPLAEMELITRLMQISGSAVQYGASSDYSGDRGTICEIDGQTSLEVNVAMLLDNYGLLDMSYYLGNDGQDHTAHTEPDETEVISESISYISCRVDDLLNDLDQNAMRASRNYNGQYLHLTGKINSFDTDGNSFTLEGLDYDITQSSGVSYTIRCMITDDTQLGNLLNANVGDTVVISCLVTEIDEFWGYTVDTISVDSIIEAEEEPPQVTEQVLPTTPPVAEPLTGTVLHSAGELKVRSGPGTNYSEIDRLSGGDTVTIYEETYVDGTTWCNIGHGWVSRDYIVFGVDHSTAPQYAPDFNTSVGKTGSVLRSAGELKVRSGPGTGYHEIDRLNGGEIVTIYEERFADGINWGNIGYGWVSLDYVVFGIDNSQPPASYAETSDEKLEEYVGKWTVPNSGRTNVTISRNGRDFTIQVIGSNGASLSTHWDIYGQYDYSENAIYYQNGVSKDVIYEDGIATEHIRYTTGNGCFVLRNGILSWHEAMEGNGDYAVFEKCP